MLTSSWNRCWSGIEAQGDGVALMHRLVSAYQEPQRKYHTLQHLSECLMLLSQHRGLAVEPDEVEMALWFHDAIYDAMAHDNEVRSAEWAARELSDAGVSAARIERVVQHILATRHSVLPEGRDQELLVDIDLAILGAERLRFQAFERQVREEYAWVPEPLFRQKRAEVLEGFLGRPQLYRTPALREALEAQARVNLAGAIAVLRGAG